MKRLTHLALGLRVATAITMIGFSLPAAANGPAAMSEDGAKIFRTKCAVCHTVEKEKHRVGPSLYGVVGRKAGTAPGFTRYTGLKEASYSWDDAALDTYLEDPDKFVKAKGGKHSGMAFKLPKPEERKAVIEYLKTVK